MRLVGNGSVDPEDTRELVPNVGHQFGFNYLQLLSSHFRVKGGTNEELSKATKRFTEELMGNLNRVRGRVRPSLGSCQATVECHKSVKGIIRIVLGPAEYHVFHEMSQSGQSYWITPIYTGRKPKQYDFMWIKNGIKSKGCVETYRDPMATDKAAVERSAALSFIKRTFIPLAKQIGLY